MVKPLCSVCANPLDVPEYPGHEPHVYWTTGEDPRFPEVPLCGPCFEADDDLEALYAPWPATDG